jgi:hypothetical protein
MKDIVSLLMTLALGFGLVTQGVHCADKTSKQTAIETEKNKRWTLFRILLQGTWRIGVGSAALYFAGRAKADYANQAPKNQKLDDSTKTKLGLSAALCATLGIDFLYRSMQKNWAEKKRQQQAARAQRQEFTGCVVSPNAKIEDPKAGIAYMKDIEMIDQIRGQESSQEEIASRAAHEVARERSRQMEIKKLEQEIERFKENIMMSSDLTQRESSLNKLKNVQNILDISKKNPSKKSKPEPELSQKQRQQRLGLGPISIKGPLQTSDWLK